MNTLLNDLRYAYRMLLKSPVVSVVVLVRQGLTAWLQLREPLAATPRVGIEDAEHHSMALPAPKRTELLAVLTGLVFNIRHRKESA